MKFYTKDKGILGGRLCLARTAKQMQQKDLAKEVTETFNRKYADIYGTLAKMSVGLVSAWETGRRHVPEKYESTIAEVLGVTIEYLKGYTDDPSSTVVQVKEQADSAESGAIDITDLAKYDGQPLWLEFVTFEHSNTWGIYNAVHNVFMLRNGAYKVKRPYDLRVYTSIPDYEEKSVRTRKALDLARVLKSQKVFVQMTSPDPIIRAKYNGWYYHNDNQTCLINPYNGLTLPYEGLSVSYFAYSVGDPSSYIPEE